MPVMHRSVYWVLFLLLFTLEFSAGFYVSHVIGYVHSDSMSRVANAFYVLYSRDPHLGAIGFVWNPLPSVIELFLLLPYHWFPELASSALAGVIMSSVFAGMTAVLLARAAVEFGLSRRFAVILSISFSCNPFIFLFGANGLSDAPFIYFIMSSVIHLCHWMHGRRVGSLFRLSFMLALAFWTRYEAVPLGAALALAVILIVFWIPPSDPRVEPQIERNLKFKLFQIEGTWALILAPVVYSGLIWIWLNYLIMDNALYFLNSEYSNVAQAQGLGTDQQFLDMQGNPLLGLIFVAKKTMYYSLPLLSIVVLRIWNRRWMVWDFLVLACLFASILALQFLLLMKGTSYGWFRYFMYVLPITVAWLPYELSRVKRSMVNYSIVLVGMIASGYILTQALMSPVIAPDENKFLHAKEYAAGQQVEKEIANYLDTELDGYNILMDSYSAYAIILNSKAPSKFLITSDLMFKDSLQHPIENGVDFILSPKPDKSSALSADNATYLNFYEKGTSWTQLYKEFGGKWRLYKIIRPVEGGGKDESAYSGNIYGDPGL
ncbi:glycosyltransferase family 39 protein [Paenibacillus sp. WQ 127069]|uniref:Glycosyltransferase family 39 protein n=1 Tax=Paenibacillus baimaensis TaxID=2982185 RepID=A0ABT2USI4_9BACL|nr:glycosyltransferase family 39 protein [Paenibacillus sp. WQ 127069]MCU6797597.1 glycosyltransferase family 39 protein [Paenibacillus sp. WQ 127069]